VRAEEPASRYFGVEELPFDGFWQKVRVWLTSAADAVVAWDIPRPSRVCVIRSDDGTIVYEKRCYWNDTSTVQNLRSILESSTVQEFIQVYDLPVTLS